MAPRLSRRGSRLSRAFQVISRPPRVISRAARLSRAASGYLERSGYLEGGVGTTRASRWLGPLRMTRSDTRNSPPLRSLRSPRADQSCSCSLGVAYRAVPAGLPLTSCVLAFGLPRPGRGSNLRPRLSPSLSLSGFSEAEARAEDGGITRECRSNLLKSLRYV